MKLLTIIIPSFNMEKYLPKNLDNLVKAQHIEDVEILVVNDGSTDKTLEIAKKYEQECPSVNVIDKPNGHYGSCLNAALQVATGKYFRILDADDWFEPEALDTFIERLKATDADLVVTLRKEWKLMNDGSWKVEELPIHGVEYNHLYDAPHFEFTKYSKLVEFNMHSMTYKTEILRQTGLVLPHGICYTDMLYCIVPLDSIKQLIIFDIYLYNYFVGREGNSTSQSSVKRNLGHISQVLYHMLTYISNHPASTPEVRSNQMRYVKEAWGILVYSLLMNVCISKDLYEKYMEPARVMLQQANFEHFKLRKYYLRGWYKKGGYYRLVFWMLVYRILHPKFWTLS